MRSEGSVVLLFLLMFTDFSPPPAVLPSPSPPFLPPPFQSIRGVVEIIVDNLQLDKSYKSFAYFEPRTLLLLDFFIHDTQVTSSSLLPPGIPPSCFASPLLCFARLPCLPACLPPPPLFPPSPSSPPLPSASLFPDVLSAFRHLGWTSASQPDAETAGSSF